MSGAYENKGAMAATIVVAASDSLNKAAANYVCDGVADNVEIQAAIDALPVGGGKVVLLEGTYVFAATVTRAIDNITIQGQGRSTYISYDDATAIFNSGAQDRWMFKNFATDAGGITTTASCVIDNCWVDDVLIDNLTQRVIRGVDNFGGYGSYTTIALAPPLDNTDYRVVIIPTADPAMVGEVWISDKAVNSFRVNNTGSGVSAFEYFVVPY